MDQLVGRTWDGDDWSPRVELKEVQLAVIISYFAVFY